MAAMDIILPRVCIVCGRRLLTDEKHLCLECLADMPMTRFWERSHNPMADKFNEIIQEKSGYPERYAFVVALIFYQNDADYRRIPYQIKYHGNLAAGRYFGQMLGRKLAESRFFGDVDVIVPVPLHWARRWKRGYNQAETFAMELSYLTDRIEKVSPDSHSDKSFCRGEVPKRRGSILSVRRCGFEARGSQTCPADRRCLHYRFDIICLFPYFAAGLACRCPYQHRNPGICRTSIEIPIQVGYDESDN